MDTAKVLDFKPPIMSAALELTNECQNTCEICHAHNGRSVRPPRAIGQMRYEDFTRIVDDLLGQDPLLRLQVALSYGGESLMHPRYDDCIAYLKRTTRTIPMVYTNGLLLEHHLKALRDVNLNISLHRQGYSKTVDAIKAYAKATSMLAIVHIVAGNGVSPGEFTEWEIMRIHRDLGDVAEVQEHPFISDTLDNGRVPSTPCSDPFRYIAVLWDGETLPCCHILSPGSFTMGNAIKYGVLEVWRGERYQDLREGEVFGTPCKICRLHLGINVRPS